MNNTLVQVSSSNIISEGPLDYPIYRKDGTLLAQKGATLTDAQASLLFDAGEIFTQFADLVNYYALRESKPLPQSANDDDGATATINPLKRLGQLEKVLLNIFYDPARANNAEQLIWMVERILAVCDKSPEAAIAKLFIDNKRLYAVQHSIHVACLCELTARAIGWDTEQRRNLVGAALTMNLSMGILQDRLQKQSKPLNSQQKRLINDHPDRSVRLLKKIGVTDKDWLEYVYMHHETPDGKGYPDGVSAEEIPQGASLVRLADVYTAKISGRTYRAGVAPPVAAKQLFLGLDKELNANILNQFVKLIGMFPAGTLVKLKNGDICSVYKQGDKINTPYVMLLQGKSGKRYDSKRILRETNTLEHGIAAIAQSEDLLFKFDFTSMWEI